MNAPVKPPEQLSNSKDRFDHYWEYAKLWRTWVVGIAAAALFILLNKDIGGRFESRACVATLFIVAAGLQVFCAWVNKTAAYYEYQFECDRDSNCSSGCWTKFWCLIGRQYWIDCLLDLLSLILVAYAVCYMVYQLLTS